MALDGQKIVVIGGSSGMGLATARAAALDGAEVTIASSRQERVDAALGELPDGCVGSSPRRPRRDAGRRLVRARRRVRSPGVHRRRRIHAASTCRPQPQRRAARSSTFASGARSPSSSTQRPGSGPEDQSG